MRREARAALLFLVPALVGCVAALPHGGQEATASSARYGAPVDLDPNFWPIVLDVPARGITQDRVTVAMDRVTGSRRYKAGFRIEPVDGSRSPPCCLLSLTADEGDLPARRADALLPVAVEEDARGVVADRRDGGAGRIDFPELRYLPFTGIYQGEAVGCFGFLGATAAVILDGRNRPVTYHGLYCERGAPAPNRARVLSVIGNLRARER